MHININFIFVSGEELFYLTHFRVRHCGRPLNNTVIAQSHYSNLQIEVLIFLNIIRENFKQLIGIVLLCFVDLRPGTLSSNK